MTTRAGTTAHSEWSSAPDKSFITTAAFMTEFYQYSVKRDDRPPFTTTGSLVLHTSASAANCPAGRVLHANGKRLLPDVNAMNSFTAGATVTAKKFMLGVYDPESMLNGFIDPTSGTFAVYDKNRPASDYLLNATTGISESSALLGLGGQGARLPAKLSIGNVATSLVAGSSSIGSLAAATGGILPGASVSVTVLTSAIGDNSQVFLSTRLPYIVATCGTVTSGTSFVINLTNVGSINAPTTTPANGCYVNWLVVN